MKTALKLSAFVLWHLAWTVAFIVCLFTWPVTIPWILSILLVRAFLQDVLMAAEKYTGKRL